jgi:hypothetical protein
MRKLALLFVLLPFLAVTACDDATTGPLEEAAADQLAVPSFDMGGNENAVQFSEFPLAGIGLNVSGNNFCFAIFPGAVAGPDDWVREHKTENGMVHVNESEADLVYFDAAGRFEGTGKWSFRSVWGPGLRAPLVFHVNGLVTNVLAPSDTRRLKCVYDTEEGTLFIRLGDAQYGTSGD